jgi:hypothetical protein
VTWPLPELDVGEEPELKPPEPELLELLELEEDEPEPVEPEPELVEPEPEPVEPEPELAEPEPELVEPEPDEPEFELGDPEFVEEEPVEDEPADVEEEDVLALCVDPGKARASAPAVTTLAMVTALVVDRTLLRPCSLAATARRIPSRCELLMFPILRSRIRKSLHEPSG